MVRVRVEVMVAVAMEVAMAVVMVEVLVEAVMGVAAVDGRRWRRLRSSCLFPAHQKATVRY